jgi:hypothetical protein
MRILAIGILDVVLTLPFGLANILLTAELVKPLPFYIGWTFVHSDWQPVGVTYDQILRSGFWNIFSGYFQSYSGIILSVVIFALFGLTEEARATYWRGICAITKLLGWMQVGSVPGALVDEMRFSAAHVGTNISYVPLIDVRYLQAQEIAFAIGLGLASWRDVSIIRSPQTLSTGKHE